MTAGGGRTRLVSALDVAHALARDLDLDTGLLPPDALWWARRASGVRVAVWREPRVWTVKLRERYDAPPRRLRLPMPGLVFVCMPGGQPPYVFAAPTRPRTVDAELCHCPTYIIWNVDGVPRIPGTPLRGGEDSDRLPHLHSGRVARSGDGQGPRCSVLRAACRVGREPAIRRHAGAGDDAR
jgi:hypothetical protein